jgi:D-alanyl-lipoteichoic acid acyltransferase DltB (MBOAT superfamily)
LLPIGISFYTFQTLSYTIDVYRGTVTPEKHPGIFALYVSFFPQLVAGPIERPKNLIPQFYERHSFDYSNFTNGLKRMAWGYFKKLVIADRLAVFVEQLYNSPSDFHGFEVAVGAVFFMFQLYADFSGYSDIAVGTAKVMGFTLMENFDRPHMSRSITEFWQRWHISLSTWIKDYVFMPLASLLRKGKMWGIAFAGFISLVIFGLWHGAGWNFIAFGAIFGFFYAFEIITFRVRKRLWRQIPTPILNIAGVVFTFSLITLSSIFFRSATVKDAVTLFKNLWHFSAGQIQLNMIANDKYNLVFSFLFIAISVAFQRMQGKFKSVEQFISSKSFILRWSFYILLVYIIVNFGIFNNKEFYYFQF